QRPPSSARADSRTLEKPSGARSNVWAPAAPAASSSSAATVRRQRAAAVIAPVAGSSMSPTLTHLRALGTTVHGKNLVAPDRSRNEVDRGFEAAPVEEVVVADAARPEAFLDARRRFVEAPTKPLRNDGIVIAMHDEHGLRDRRDARERLEPIFHEPPDRDQRQP